MRLITKLWKERASVDYTDSIKSFNFVRISAVIEWQKIRELVFFRSRERGHLRFFLSDRFQGGRPVFSTTTTTTVHLTKANSFFGGIPVIQTSISATRETAPRFSPILHAQARMYKLLSCRGKPAFSTLFQPVSNLNVHILLFITGPCPPENLAKWTSLNLRAGWCFDTYFPPLVPVRRACFERRFKVASIIETLPATVPIPFVCRSRLLLDVCNMRFRVNVSRGVIKWKSSRCLIN